MTFAELKVTRQYLDVLEDMGKNLQEFDHTWVAYEQIYVLELMLIEADARRFITEAIENEKERVKGENALLQLINSEHVIKAEEIYEFDDRLYLFLDYMDGKELTTIIKHFHKQYSDEFIKFTIWSSAKGL